MSTLTESRNGTWRSEPNQSIYVRRGPGESFDRQLPAEVRTELEESPSDLRARTRGIQIQPPAKPRIRVRAVGRKLEEIPPQQTYRVREVSTYQSVEEPVFLRPSPPVSVPPAVVTLSPPPVSPPQPPVTPRVPSPAQSESSAHGLWIWLLLLLGIPVVLSKFGTNSDTQPQSRPIEVRRALPAIPRALPVTSVASTVPDATSGQWQSIRMPDGTVLPVSYQGRLSSPSQLPDRGRFIGEEWSTGDTSWVWMQPVGTNFASWVDP